MLGAKIREVREAAGLNQGELGKLALGHKSGNYVCKIELEKHDPRSETLLAIARTLDCTVSYLLGENEGTDEAA